MKRVVCAVFDTVVQTYGQPLFVPAPGAALRSFMDECARPAEDNVLYKHPEDFELWYLCNFDDETGTFEVPAEAQPHRLMRGRDVKDGL